MQDETFDRAARAYVEAYFRTLDVLAEATGGAPSRIVALMAAGIAPGPVYARDPERGWWSALDGWVDGGGGLPGERAETWFSPGTTWNLRQALLAHREGVSDAAIAQSLAERFRTAFIAGLETVEPARIAFPACFDTDGRIEPTTATDQAETEWCSWLRGGYAVCLRTFTGETCVRKESLGALLKRHVADPTAWPMSAERALEACEALAALMLPFAPWERPTGTPGRTIDVLLAQHTLGREQPYG